MIKIPPILDFEASGLSSESYPIQAAWKFNGVLKNFYIKPSTAEDNWDYWDYCAQDVHGIPREILSDIGKSCDFVAREMLIDLEGQDILSDAPLMEMDWATKLFNQTPYTLNFRFISFCDFIYKNNTRNLSDYEINDIHQLIKSTCGLKAHSAENDVLILEKILLEII